MKLYRTVIVDSDEAYSAQLASGLSVEKRIKVIGCAGDGISALRLILAEKPDIVLIDPILPGLDGLLLMKELAKVRCKPMIVCLSRFYTSVSVEIARRNGACYYLYKPVEPEALSHILIECAEAFHQEQKYEDKQNAASETSAVRHRIHAIMTDLGFSSKHAGSHYIAESIAISAETPSVLNNLSSGLYAQLSQRLNTSVSCIERSMRTAISRANVNGNLARLVGSTPTNKACIRYILGILNDSIR